LRPGQRREPLTGFTVDERFAGAAAARGLTAAAAVELALERALVLTDLEELGRLQLFPALLEQAHNQRFVTPLPEPFRRYRQSLLGAEPRALDDGELELPIVVPLRLFPRVLSLDYLRALVVNALDEAVILELASLCAGRTMTEYALWFACAETRR
jgi:hypothetical protein